MSRKPDITVTSYYTSDTQGEMQSVNNRKPF